MAAISPGPWLDGAVTLLPSGRFFRLRHHPALVTSVRIAATTGRVLNNLLTVVALVSFVGLALGPHVLGYRTTTMLTGSMSPHIRPGDVEVLTEEPISRLQVGDVISYHIPVDDHRVVSHRVVGVVHQADGTTSVQTKGDANPGPDPWIATFQGGHVYQVRAVIPWVGNVIRALRTPEIARVLQFGAPALAAGMVLLVIWRRPGRGST